MVNVGKYSSPMEHLGFCLSNGCQVGGFNPTEKYADQIGSSPQGSGWNILKKIETTN